METWHATSVPSILYTTRALLTLFPPTPYNREQNLWLGKADAVPLYEYRCKKCKHRFEKIRKFSDKPLKKCPECGGPVEQLLSAPAAHFKGSGFYATDYARKGSGSAEDGRSAKPKEEKTETKTEPKKEEPTPHSKPDAHTGANSK